MTSITQFTQLNYSNRLYKAEVLDHASNVNEYNQEIYQAMLESLNLNKPNLELYKQQPYLTQSIRLKLIDFLLKMSIRLKIIPFVFFRAVKIFDRYCSKRIILLDQSQLIITTCLWIASKLQGGNNHFLNLGNLSKLNSEEIKTISDLGYGSGGKYLGPTERFRLPKLHELIKLCGNKCNYDQSMFKQMELHILQTLEWNFNDPSIEEFLIKSSDFNILIKNNEFFKIKEYLSYISLYSYELIDCDLIDLSKVMVDLINEVFNLNENNIYFQSINTPNLNEIDESEEFFIEDDSNNSPVTNVPKVLNKFLTKMDYDQYKFIKKHLIKSIINSSEFVLGLFDTKGPQYLYNQIVMTYKDPFKLSIPHSIIPQSLSPISPVSVHNSISSGSSTFSNLSSTTSNTSVSSSPSSNINAQSNYIYKPIPVASNSSLLKKYNYDYNCIPKITTHRHNNSQISINTASTSTSKEHEALFEDHRRFGVYTPVSDEESPIHFKNYHYLSSNVQSCNYKFA